MVGGDGLRVARLRGLWGLDLCVSLERGRVRDGDVVREAVGWWCLRLMI